MNIEKVYIGGWFQRTRLHLSEIYDFTRGYPSPIALDNDKLNSYRGNMNIDSVELVVDNLEYIYLKTGVIDLRIFEDGLIILETYHSHDLQRDIDILTEYYERRLSPALKYLFSLGAPVPKELANIKTVYPYFVETTDTEPERVEQLFAEFSQGNYSTEHKDGYDLYRADTLYVINRRAITSEDARRFIEEKIFLKEFRGQLHRYLNLHRTIWEEIAKVNECGRLRGKDIPEHKERIDCYAKTISFIATRIDQMDTYLHTRQKILLNDNRLISFNTELAYHHETMSDSLDYVKDIWNLTQNYVKTAQKVFTELVAKSTNNSVHNLTVVTSMGVGATLIGLFTVTDLPTISWFSMSYFIALAFFGYMVNRILKIWSENKSYGITHIDVDKDI